MQAQRTIGLPMRWPPWRHATLLRRVEHLGDIQLPAEGMHDPAEAPVVAISARHPSPDPGGLQVAAQSGIDAPLHGRRSLGSVDAGHHASRAGLSNKWFRSRLRTIQPYSSNDIRASLLPLATQRRVNRRLKSGAVLCAASPASVLRAGMGLRIQTRVFRGFG